jgi:hypothetical protein
MDPTISWYGDTFESYWFYPRFKYIHTVGDIASFKFVPTNNSEGYTGIFEGSDHGIIRLSAAAHPNEDKKTAEEAY